MGTLTDAKVVFGASDTTGAWTNEETWVDVQYSFANDGGEIEDNIVLTAGADFVILDYYAVVSTTLVGVGADLDLGVGAGGVEIWTDYDGPTLVETAGANLFVASAAMAPLYVPAAGTIQLGVETAALTAGVFKMYFKIKKV